MQSNQVENIRIKKITTSGITDADDQVAVEEPLEILLQYSNEKGRMQKNIAVTMRTPGNDEELAAGFLFTEGIIQQNDSLEEIKHVAADPNRILVTLKENIIPDMNNADRNFYSTSSCGICGKASIDAIRTSSMFQKEKDDISIEPGILYGLQDKLKEQQEVFSNTGGIHASALFSLNGTMIMLREDVGRHNALDKLIGTCLLKDMLPLKDHILLLSGRASFELVQKAAMAGIWLIASVGAPSSLAIELAKETNITLTGFLRNDRFNIYSGDHRVKNS